MKFKSFIVCLVLSSLFACGNSSTNTARLNPTPAPTSSATIKKNTFDIPTTSLSDELPNPSVEPVKPIEEFTFDLDIKFDGILGRVYVDDGEIRETPTKYTLKGGSHTVVVFDLVRLCRIAKVYYLDKNMTLDFTGKNSCINENAQAL